MSLSTKIDAWFYRTASKIKGWVGKVHTDIKKKPVGLFDADKIDKVIASMRQERMEDQIHRAWAEELRRERGINVPGQLPNIPRGYLAPGAMVSGTFNVGSTLVNPSTYVLMSGCYAGQNLAPEVRKQNKDQNGYEIRPSKSTSKQTISQSWRTLDLLDALGVDTSAQRIELMTIQRNVEKTTKHSRSVNLRKL